MTYQLIIDDFIGRWAYSKQYVRSVLDKYKSKHVDVKISSLGGDLDHGLDIRQQFIDHGDVTAYLSGFVASAATIAAMGAKRIVMSKYGHFLVHKCSNYIEAFGSYNADQMQQLIDQLMANKLENDKIDSVLASLYAAKCKRKVSEIMPILTEGRWLTADEALEIGFIDEVADFGNEAGASVADCQIEAKFAAFGLPACALSQPSTITEQPRNSALLDVIMTAAQAVKSIFGGDQHTAKSNNQPNLTMHNYDFKGAAELLKVNDITPDNDGYVSVTAEQFETLSKTLATLSDKANTADEQLAAKDAEIASLTEQVENLKAAPGAETTEISDEAEGGLTDEKLDQYIKELC